MQMLTKIGAMWAAVLMTGGVAVAGGVPDAATPQSPTPRPTQQRVTWSAQPSLPQARSEVGVAELNGRVYVVGGSVERPDTEPKYASDLVNSYDPRTRRWARHAPLPRELSHVGFASLNGKLYVFGGFTNVVHIDPQSVSYEYDPRRDRWTRLPDMPARLGSVGVAAVDVSSPRFHGAVVTCFRLGQG